MTPDWQGNAVMVNRREVIETGIMLCKDYIIALPGFMASIIGALCKETLLSVMILVHHRPLVIFGKPSFVKQNDNALNDCLFFCDLLL